MHSFPDQPLSSADYVEAARLFNLCRSRGLTAGAVDILLCAVAGANRWTILTADVGLERAIEVLRGEGIAV